MVSDPAFKQSCWFKFRCTKTFILMQNASYRSYNEFIEAKGALVSGVKHLWKLRTSGNIEKYKLTWLKVLVKYWAQKMERKIVEVFVLWVNETKTTALQW